jgi:hypothetical protein
MTDQPTPEPDDPNVSDDQLPRADRDAIRDTAKALVDGSLRMDSDAFQSLRPRIRRRAWLRYQANFEDRENVRERNARQRAARENHEADVEMQAYAERLREAEDRPRRRRDSTTAAPGTAAAFEMAVQHADDSQTT